MKATTVLPVFNSPLEVAAAQENRNLTNMLEVLGFAHCEKPSLKKPVAKESKAKGAPK